MGLLGESDPTKFELYVDNRSVNIRTGDGEQRLAELNDDGFERVKGILSILSERINDTERSSGDGRDTGPSSVSPGA